MKYRTIVADPPWDYGDRASAGWSWRNGRPSGSVRPLPYPTMSLEDIAALPVRDLSERGAHLYVWTTQRFLRETYWICEAWGFTPISTNVWCKEPRGFGPGGAFQSTVEFFIFARRGTLAALSTQHPQWYRWPRSEHSRKPDAFLDLVEQVSPGPYLELFARRQRLGWDTWGNEALEHVEMAAESIRSTLDETPANQGVKAPSGFEPLFPSAEPKADRRNRSISRDFPVG